MVMTSSKPYLVRAFHEWIVDNNLTPYVLVNASIHGVQVPPQFVKDGKIVLNISEQAVDNLYLSNEWVNFEAQFSGIKQQIRLPISSIQAIYASENGRGMFFEEQEEPPPPPTELHKKPNLKIVE